MAYFEPFNAMGPFVSTIHFNSVPRQSAWRRYSHRKTLAWSVGSGQRRPCPCLPRGRVPTWGRDKYQRRHIDAGHRGRITVLNAGTSYSSKDTVWPAQLTRLRPPCFPRGSIYFCGPWFLHTIIASNYRHLVVGPDNASGLEKGKRDPARLP